MKEWDGNSLNAECLQSCSNLAAVLQFAVIVMESGEGSEINWNDQITSWLHTTRCSLNV